MRPRRVDRQGVTGTAIPEQIREAMMWHAVACLPDEACGLVAADSHGRLRMAYPLTNADAAPSRFTIAPREHFGAVVHAESRGWEIGAVFHSHPVGDAEPSPTDIAQPHDPDWLHIIVGFAPSPHIRAWQLRDSAVEEVEIIDPGNRTTS